MRVAFNCLPSLPWNGCKHFRQWGQKHRRVKIVPKSMPSLPGIDLKLEQRHYSGMVWTGWGNREECLGTCEKTWEQPENRKNSQFLLTSLEWLHLTKLFRQDGDNLSNQDGELQTSVMWMLDRWRLWKRRANKNSFKCPAALRFVIKVSTTGRFQLG